MRAPASVRPVPGQPGVYLNEATGEVFKLVEFRDDDKYDTEDLASGNIAAGTALDYFVTQTDKDDIDTNFDTPRRLSKGETMIISRIGVDVPLAVGNTIIAPADVKKIAYSGFLSVKVNKIVITEGPLYKFPSGYGLAGQTVENAAGVVTIGVPSTAARRPLEKAHFITHEHDLFGRIEFQSRTWDTDATTVPNLATAAHVRLFVGGLISQAATK